MPLIFKNKPFNKVLNDVKKTLDKLPAQIGAIAVNTFRENFQKQGFEGMQGFAPWKPSAKKGGKTLLGSGNLFRGIKYSKTSNRSVDIYVDGLAANYADIHNQGGVIRHPGGTPYFIKGTGAEAEAVFVSKAKAEEIKQKYKRTLRTTASHNIPMPQRQFIGDSKVLRERIKELVQKQILKAFTEKQ